MKSYSEFIPKSFLSLRKGYSLSLLKKDLTAGITVGIIALPLAMAFGIASGVSPERGLFTAIVAGFLISLLGGSRYQIGGPTGAFVVIVYDIIQRTGYEGLAISTLLASVFLIAMALFRFGSWIKYVPHPLITGFTTGLALIVFSSQIKDFFGLKMDSMPADFVDKWEAYFRAFPTFDPTTLLFGLGTLAFILFMRKFFPKVPWGIAAIVVSTLAAASLRLPLETIQSKFGAIPHSLPLPSLPSFSFPISRLDEILKDAAAIAILGGIESLLSCVIADGMTGGRHRSNTELFGQGIANLFSVLFGGIPATGAIARTAANVKCGAQTPIAGMVHAITLFAIIWLLSPVVSQIPLAALAAVLMMVAWNMSEAGHFIRMMRAPVGDVAILATAFFLTVLVDIIFAISVGMILASFLFMKRMGDFSKTVAISKEKGEDVDAIGSKIVPEGVEVFEIQGPFFFGAADMLKDLMEMRPKVFILRMRNVPMIDASGMHALKEFYRRCEKEKISVLLAGVQPHAEAEMKRFGLGEVIGEDRILPHIDAAIEKAASLIK